MQVCPLIFEPIFKPKVWGGRNLERLLDKRLPPNESIGESWECADLPTGQSIVAAGPAKGKTLAALVDEWGPSLLGRAAPFNGRFPLLIKFLDATAELSVQVHPVDRQSRPSGDESKHEAWYVIDAAPDACVYRGLRPGVSVSEFAHIVHDDPPRTINSLNRILVKAGDTLYVPSGTVHAIGSGVVVAEVQAPMDVTYRLYDWGRSRPGGDAGLHIAEGLAAIREEPDLAAYEKKSHVTSMFTTVTRLITCPRFIIERVRFVAEMDQPIPYAELVCWIVLQGTGEVHHGPGRKQPFKRGDVVILPAGLENPRLQTLTDCMWLEVTVPAPSDLADFPRLDTGQSAANPSDGAFIPLGISVTSKNRPPD